MATLLQLHFAFNGPFGDAMAEQLNRLLSRLIRNLVFCGRYGQKVKRTTKPVGSIFLLMKKAPLPIWKNILPDLKISALRKLSPKFSMSMSH